MRLHLKLRTTESLLSAGLVMVLLAIYQSSLRHIPRSDHWAVLQETINLHDFWSLLKHGISFTRARVIYPGDTTLFRPGVGFVWAAEKTLFGAWSEAAQLLGIALHALVTLLLVRFAAIPPLGDSLAVRRPRRLSLSLLSYGAALFFGTSFAIQEQVIWGHIHGYFVFSIAVICAFRATLSAVVQCESGISMARPGYPAGAAWACLLISVFFLEIGQMYCLLVGILFAHAHLRKSRDWKGAALRLSLFLAPVALYQLCNLSNLAHWNTARDPEGWKQVLNAAPSWATVVNLWRFLKYTLIQPFFPFSVGANPTVRLNIIETPVSEMLFAGPAVVFSWIALSLWLLLTGLASRAAFRRTGRRGTSRRRPAGAALALLASLVLMYGMVYVLGRLNLRSEPNQLEIGSYYAYFPLSLLVLGSVLLWNRGRAGIFAIGKKRALFLVSIFLATLSLVIGASASRVVDVNRLYAARAEEWIRLMPAVREFIDLHKEEPDFGIAFDLRRLGAVGVLNGVPFPSFLFRQHENNSRPKYIIGFTPSSILVTTYEDYLRSHPEARGRDIFPDLLEIRETFRVYKFNGRFLSVPNATGIYDPAIADPILAPVAAPTQAEAIRLGEAAFQSRESPHDRARGPELVQELLQGAWISSCEPLPGRRGVRLVLRVNGNGVIGATRVYLDERCSDLAHESRTEGRVDFVINSLEERIDPPIGSADLSLGAERAFVSFAQPADLPEPGYCGIDRWLPQREYEVTLKPCGLPHGPARSQFRLQFTKDRLDLQPMGESIAPWWRLRRPALRGSKG